MKKKSKITAKNLEDMEDEWFAAKARETLKDIEEGRDRLIPWEECIKAFVIFYWSIFYLPVQQ